MILVGQVCRDTHMQLRHVRDMLEYIFDYSTAKFYAFFFVRTSMNSPCMI